MNFLNCHIKTIRKKLFKCGQAVLSALTGSKLRDATSQENNINFEEYTSTATVYISECVDDVVIN